MVAEWLEHPRRMLLVLGSLCLGAVGIAVALGLAFNLEVCAMCWFQRLALILAALGFLLAATRSAAGGIAQRLGELGLVIGWASSCRQVYLLFHPEAASGNCGAGLMYYLEIGNYEGFFRAGLLGGIECATEQASILGLPLPLWSLIAFSEIGFLYLFWQILCTRSAQERTRQLTGD